LGKTKVLEYERTFTVFDWLREKSLLRTRAICKLQVNSCDIPCKEKNVRKIGASMLMALDGVVENPQWTSQFRREDSQNYKFDELFVSDALLLGRRTYQEFAASWPSMQGTGKYGERMNSLPKFVVSTTLSEMEWNASLLSGNLAEEVSRIRQQPGQDVLIFGSGELVHSLMSLDLIDEYRLMVFPVVVGSGKRLFREGSEKKVLKLIETRTFSSGVIVLTYRPDRP
jgi:dihydrofolate reductase